MTTMRRKKKKMMIAVAGMMSAVALFLLSSPLFLVAAASAASSSTATTTTTTQCFKAVNEGGHDSYGNSWSLFNGYGDYGQYKGIFIVWYAEGSFVFPTGNYAADHGRLIVPAISLSEKSYGSGSGSSGWIAWKPFFATHTGTWYFTIKLTAYSVVNGYAYVHLYTIQKSFQVTAC
jgi:hypothetical protein